VGSRTWLAPELKMLPAFTLLGGEAPVIREYTPKPEKRLN
jgi:hypothetical protein